VASRRLDEGDELAAALAHDLADLWIVAGSRGLSSADEPAAFVAEHGIGRGNILERSSPRAPAAARSTTSRVSATQRRTAASKRFRFVPNRIRVLRTR